MDITFLGHSSFRIKGKKASVVTDPFDPSVVGFKFPKVVADVVTISHTQHDDHKSSELVQDVKMVFDKPGEYEVMGVSFIGLSTYHDDKRGELRGKNTVFVVELDGLRIAHLGDLGHKLSEKKLETMGEIDVLMIPVGGHYTMNQEVAVQVAQSIESPVTIPMHYQMPGLNKETFKDLVGYDDFVTKMGLPKEDLSTLSITKDTIGENERIVILEKK